MEQSLGSPLAKHRLDVCSCFHKPIYNWMSIYIYSIYIYSKNFIYYIYIYIYIIETIYTIYTIYIQ